MCSARKVERQIVLKTILATIQCPLLEATGIGKRLRTNFSGILVLLSSSDKELLGSWLVSLPFDVLIPRVSNLLKFLHILSTFYCRGTYWIVDTGLVPFYKCSHSLLKMDSAIVV